jgi:AraC-like DNA-binding protein
VQRAWKYIHEHFREPVRLAEIARVASLSPAYFSSVFHRYAGMTVTTYLQLTRVNAAKDILAKTSERITDIAFDTGFNNLTHFNRVFCKIAGCSPREYRRRNKPGPSGHAVN